MRMPHPINKWTDERHFTISGLRKEGGGYTFSTDVCAHV